VPVAHEASRLPSGLKAIPVTTSIVFACGVAASLPDGISQRRIVLSCPLVLHTDMSHFPSGLKERADTAPWCDFTSFEQTLSGTTLSRPADFDRSSSGSGELLRQLAVLKTAPADMPTAPRKPRRPVLVLPGMANTGTISGAPRLPSV
jgi:hypothetical protein